MRTVLISGAGVAGPTLAYWLARAGFRPTVVERAAGQRSSGSPVDVHGSAMSVVEQMGVVDALRAAATHATGMRFVDASGRMGRRMAMSTLLGDADTEIEVPRADLARILSGAVRDDAEFIYDDTITALDQDPDGVDVTFERTAARRFDLIVGADGLHSTVRRIAFGPERDFVRDLGLYLATTPLGEPPREPHDVLLYNTPGRLVAIHPVRGEAGVLFLFRHPAASRGAVDGRRMLAEAFSGERGWRVPELLDRALRADDLYFDAVSKVILPSWSAGRVVLLGDAAASVSLFGDGSSMAIVGARTLAGALAAHFPAAHFPAAHFPAAQAAAGSLTADGYVAAFRGYETEHRRRANVRGRGAGLVAGLLVPRSRPGIVARNSVARLLPAAR